MKILLLLLSLLIISPVYSQNNLLNIEKDSIISFMNNRKTTFQKGKDSVTLLGFNYLEYFYSSNNIPDNGICAYVFYFESFDTKCTSIRAVILEEKIDVSVNMMNHSLTKVDTNKWYEQKENILFTLYTVKHLKTNDTFYVLDITNFK